MITAEFINEVYIRLDRFYAMCLYMGYNRDSPCIALSDMVSVSPNYASPNPTYAFLIAIISFSSRSEAVLYSGNLRMKKHEAVVGRR